MAHVDLVEARLDALQARYPLGDGWRAPELHRETLRLGGRRIELWGMVARGPGDASITAAAAGPACAGLARCWFELLERVAAAVAARGLPGAPLPVLDTAGRVVGRTARSEVFPGAADPARWRPSLSSGTAAHPDPEGACERAWLELVERDRVLRSWFGLAPAPREIGSRAGPTAALGDRFEHRVVRFDDASDPEADVAVVGAFLLPHGPDHPFCCGFAAARDEAGALAGAETECLQRLGFLSGEPLPVEPPPLDPDPELHLDHFLFPPHQGAIRAWLDDLQPVRPPKLEGGERSREPTFVDLTPSALAGRAWVVRAQAPGRLPLGFGAGHPRLRGVSPAREVHPIA